MTLYHTDRRVEIVAVDLVQTPWLVWWAYYPDEFDEGVNESEPLSEDCYGIHCDPVTRLDADGGREDLLQHIKALPAGRVRGYIDIVEEVRAAC